MPRSRGCAIPASASACASSSKDWLRRLPRAARRLGAVIVDGESIADLAARNGARPIDIYCERCADSRLSASALVLMGNEENVRAIMAHPRHTAGSDGILVGERPTRAAGARSRAISASTCASWACSACPSASAR